MRHNRRSDFGIGHVLRQTLKASGFGHFALRQSTEPVDVHGKDDAARAALPVLAARPVIAKRSNVKRRRARFLKELAPRGLHRRFARLDMAALKLPCRSLLMAAEQKTAVHARHDDDVFIPFKAAQRIGLLIIGVPPVSEYPIIALSAAHVKPASEGRPLRSVLRSPPARYKGTIRASIVLITSGSNVAASRFGASSQTPFAISLGKQKSTYPQTATHSSVCRFHRTQHPMFRFAVFKPTAKSSYSASVSNWRRRKPSVPPFE